MSGLSYVLPVRTSAADDLAELTSYLLWLSGRVELIVVDGSDPPVFSRNALLWAGLGRHVPPRPGLRFSNGKVDGVVTGVELAATPNVVVADDDVRYDERALQTMEELLDRYDLVRPQNYFDPLPWHALWDTGRTLLNRSFAADYPGTLGVSRELFLRVGGYDGNAMFENLEMIRTMEVAGGSSIAPLDLFVRRIPPDARHFLSQRTRQAYDDLAQPWRLALFLSIGPAALAAARRRPALLPVGALAIVALAERGRRRERGTEVFPPQASAMAPLWVGERALCVWIALVHRVLGGVPYRGKRIRVAAHSRRAIRRRLRDVEQGRSRP